MPQLHKSHAALHESSSDQNLPGLRPFAVQIENVLRLAADIERLGHFLLHAVRQLEGLNSRFQLRILLPGLFVPPIERLHQVQLLPLGLGGKCRTANILDQLFDVGVLRVDVRALKHARQKTGLPVLRFLNRIAAGAHRHEGRQILILGPQAVRDPGAHAGANQPSFAAIHQQQRRLVIRHVGLHRPHDGNVVDALAARVEKSR